MAEQWVADEALDQAFWLVLSHLLGLAEPRRSWFKTIIANVASVSFSGDIAAARL